MSIPDLPPNCNSWIVVNRATNQAALETSSRDLLEKINLKNYKIVTALDWLVSLNA
jgi:hypothetical protein